MDSLKKLPIRAGAAALVVHEGKLLMGRRLKDPNRDKYALPGGGIRAGESAEQAVLRELKEEANADIKVGEKIYNLHIPEPDKVRLIDYFQCQLLNDPSQLKGNDDLGEPMLFGREQIWELYLTGEISPPMYEVLVATGWLAEENPQTT